MPRYYFDLSDHEQSTDRTGVEFRDADMARKHAVVFAGEYLRDHPELIWDGKEIRVIVRNEDDLVVFTVITLSVDCL
ncbi:DUF6894 family protein [Sphingomonas sp.]|uniref:DUF6894 family protein n=1 Tax=Sphingomonas sp. TaxID=28214 RepID=UPI002DD65C2C|nr:hypothetical protein [Sphingomonas sp.]